MLAGGRSSRMGRDKAYVEWDGRALAVCAAVAMRDAGLEVSIIRRGSAVEDWRWPEGGRIRVVRESDQGPRHALNGLVTALEDARSSCMILPCDVPRIGPEHLMPLLRAGAPAVAFDGARVHPLVGLYPWGWLERARDHVGRGGSATSFAAAASRVLLPAVCLHNVNRPEDLP